MRWRRTAGIGALLLSLTLVAGGSTRPVVIAREEARSEGHEEEEREELEFGSGRGEPEHEEGFRCSFAPTGFFFRPVTRCAPTAVAAGSVSAQRFRFTRKLIGTGGDTESTIAFGPRGSTLACSHGGFESASAVWSSPDGGSSWRRSDPAPNPIVSGDCDLAVMDDGTWVVVFDTIANATVATSRDRGKSWTINPVTALPVGVDRPWIVADGKRLLMGYANVQSNLPALQFVAVSKDRGRTWLEQHLINTFDLPDRPNGIFGRPVVHGRTVRAPISMQNVLFGGPAYLYLVTSRDGGATWERTLVRDAHPTSVHFPALTVARNGTLYVGYPTGARSAQDMTVSVLASTNDGRTWTQIDLAKHVAFPGQGVAAVWVDARPDGSATAAWMAQTRYGRQVWAARVGPKGVLVPAQAISPAVEDESSFEFIMVDHDARGRAHVVAPLDTGPSCHGPSITGGRLRQCVYDFVER